LHHRVVHHQRQPVDERLLSNGLRFRDAGHGDARFLVGFRGGGDGIVFLLAASEEGDRNSAGQQYVQECSTGRLHLLLFFLDQ
jgi:hypothetical protein